MLITYDVMNESFWHAKRVLVTGHTGFKGSWLTCWLHQMNVSTAGFALPPQTPRSLFADAALGEQIQHIEGDIRDAEKIIGAVKKFKPQILFHLAAQAIVADSYTDPSGTYATNVMGTLNVLEAARQSGSVETVVIVTSDKCYENKSWAWPYRETDPLGGNDIYSSSKACTEILTHSYRKSFLEKEGIKVASVRAGNVIGGGDWAAHRIVPDIVRAAMNKETLLLRRPGATRPWQHVLDPLSGYLTVAEKLSTSSGGDFAQGWNFGPNTESERPVLEMVHSAKRFFPKLEWQVDPPPFEEATYLAIDSSLARHRLSWQPRWNWAKAVDFSFEWYKRQSEGESARGLMEEHLKKFCGTESV